MRSLIYGFCASLFACLMCGKAFCEDAALQSRAATLAEHEISASGPIHSLLITKDGRNVLELYRSGPDHPWGKPKGMYEYNRDALHDMRSISKSVVSLLVGIEIDRGKIDLDRSIFDYLPEYLEMAELSDPGKTAITVRNLLAMDSGLLSDEMGAYAGEYNTERLMNEADDPYGYAVARKMIRPPGEMWAYDSDSTMLLSRILQNVTNKDIAILAKTELFEPMGIDVFEWIRLKRSGEYAAQGGLRLRPRDLVKLGELVLADGQWNGRQLVSKSWLRLSTTAIHDAWYTEQYGLHWWSGATILENSTIRWVEAIGIGGQRLYIVPELDMVVVITAGLYDYPNQRAIVRQLFEDVALKNFAVH